MASPRVIGVDLGGTKVLAGVVDAGRDGARDGRAPDRDDVAGGAPRRARGDRARAAAGRRLRRSASASRRASTTRTGLALGAVNIPIRDVRFADEMQQRLGLPVEMENDASCAAYAEFKLGAGRGTTRPARADPRHRRRRRRRLGRQALPCLHRARPHGDRRGRRAVPGRVLRPRARRGVLLRDGGRQGREARPRPGRDRARPRRAGASRARRDRPPPRRSRSGRS